jgi:K(+)-stimulated pyrophosphate-energized sodium pump
MVGTITGIVMATFKNNAAGAWGNAKKYIELGAHGGKGSEAHKASEAHRASEAHKASVVGDTVGDPFKDTAGPSIHVLIKLLTTITLVAAPLFL